MRTTISASKQNLEGVEAADSLSLFLERHIHWSKETFGPGSREEGVLDHLAKEMEEIRSAEDAAKVDEWVDMVILSIDGLQRAMGDETPPAVKVDQIISALYRKQKINREREWPDWRNLPADKAIEHTKSKGAKT